jgi:S1-C subfamily serine protease
MNTDNNHYQDQGPFSTYRTENQAEPTSNPYTNQHNQPVSQPSQPSTSGKPPSRKSKTTSLIHRVEIVAVVIILLVATFFAIILIAPESPFAQTVVKNTFLNRFINLEASSEDPEEPDVVVNNNTNEIVEIETDPADIPPFTFKKPPEAKTTVEIINEVLPSVLSISVQRPDSGGLAGQSLVAGTGFIVSEEGLVVTNKHVISPQCQFGETVEILASNQDHDIYKLRLLTVDPIYDIAVLEIQNPPQGLVPVSFSNSENLQLGSEVIAVGNTLGELQNTVTQGIISGLSRSLDTDLVDECTNSPVFADGLIQTDAAINQGNSGGPLFDASGQIVGMNTFGTQGAENVGLAIPSNAIVSALNSYRENNVIERPKLGIFSRSITPLLEDEESWLPVDYGEIIIAPQGQRAVEKGSSADLAGLEEGDIILEINDTPIEATQSNPSPLRRALLNFEPGDTIKMTILKNVGTRLDGFEYESQSTEVNTELGKIVFDI